MAPRVEMVNFCHHENCIGVIIQQNGRAQGRITGERALVSYLCVIHTITVTYKLYPLKLLNDLLGGRGWWLVKGALVRGPFLYITDLRIERITQTISENGL